MRRPRSKGPLTASRNRGSRASQCRSIVADVLAKTLLTMALSALAHHPHAAPVCANVAAPLPTVALMLCANHAFMESLTGEAEMPRESVDSGERAGLERIAGVTRQLAELETMSVTQLVARYRELYDAEPRSKNKAHLQKLLAWRIQELADGGLSGRAKARIAELAPLALAELHRRQRRRNPDQRPARDPRLPPPGTVLRRTYRDEEHQVTVLGEGFEYRGAIYRSLSQVAREITGTRWNGYLFFRLASTRRRG